MHPDTAAAIQRRFDALLDHLPAGVVIHDADGRISTANRRACELLGQHNDRLLGTGATAPVWQFVRHDGTPMPSSEYPANRVLQGAGNVEELVVGARIAGVKQMRWMICNAYPELGPDGALRHVIVCFTDCTALKSAQERLQKSEERLRLVLRGSADASWDYDLLSGEVYYSERWWTMLGYAPNALPADAALGMTLMHPDDKPRVSVFMEDLLDQPIEDYCLEYRLRHRDGHYVPILSRGFVMRDPGGKALRVSGTNTDLTERKRAEQHMYELAYADYLTGLPNRRFLIEELRKILARSHRSDQVGALLLLDLDNFKLLNDTMGHDFGDQLLRQVAQRLHATLRNSDQLARLGGDEFVIVLEDLGPDARLAATEADHVVGKLLDKLREPYRMSGQSFPITPSMGVAMFDGATADIDPLLKQADLAMYRAKSEGGNTARFFDPGMQAAADTRAALENALREGLARHQFLLFCQPQFNWKGELIGGEVLLRWRRGPGGVLGPDDFIGLAESSGLIVPLGQYVLEDSCRALARWAAHPVLGKLKLAVNVSAYQMRHAGFVGSVAHALARTGAPADRLWLELTESAFAGDPADIIGKMRALRDQGIHFTLDDFGTGYSSLAYLRRFPLAGLKIDRSFVQDVPVDADAVPIVEAIIALARKLKLDIVAEGVEHEAQRSFLAEGGCCSMQGYLFGRPIPIEEFERVYGTPAPHVV